MAAGFIADFVVLLYIIIVVAICTKRGFLRDVIKSTSTFVALVVVFFGAKPLANFLNSKFDLVTQIDNWHVPFVQSSTILWLLTAIGLFIAVRLLLLIVDKLFSFLKERVRAINIVDRILGFVFGVGSAAIGLLTIFLLINALSLQSFLQLTPESGGIFAHRLFSFCQTYVFPWASQWLANTTVI